MAAKQSITYKEIFKRDLFTENPVFIQVIGMCPTLATTTSAINGLGMGLATAVVLMASNFVISAIRNVTSPKVRIPVYIVVIAAFVTILQFFIKAYVPALDKSLGIYIPLIVANCIPLARAEMFAAKNGVIKSAADGIATGLGFTLALTLVGVIREFLATGSAFDIMILPEAFPKTLIFILAPGAFFTLAGIIAVINYNKEKGKLRERARLSGRA